MSRLSAISEVSASQLPTQYTARILQEAHVFRLMQVRAMGDPVSPCYVEGKGIY